MPGQYGLNIYRGDSYSWQFTFWIDVAQTVPLDLTNATAKAEIRTQPGGNLITTLDLNITLPNIILVTLTSPNSYMLTMAGGVWDLQLTYTDGSVLTVLAGYVSVTMDVTDSAPNVVVGTRPQLRVSNG
jgi:hypothetical protein